MMRLGRTIAILIALMIYSPAGAQVAAQRETRLSLVIGIQGYAGGAELERPRADAIAVNEALKSINFAATGDVPLFDGDRSRIEAAVADLSNRAADARRRGEFVTLFVYFSGHGLGVPGFDNDIYLLPRDFAPPPGGALSIEEMDARAVRLGWVRAQLAGSADQIIFVIDACRTPGTVSAAQSMSPRPTDSSGTVRTRVAMLFAAPPGSTAPDDGAFSMALAESLRGRDSIAAVANEMSNRLGLPAYFTSTERISLRTKAMEEAARASATVPLSKAMPELGDAANSGKFGTDIRNAAVVPELRDYVKKYGLAGTRARAETGDATAQFMLGLGYSFGLRVNQGEKLPEDWVEAAKWLQRAQFGGELRAANTLGFIHYEGKLGEKNEREGIRIWEAAAERSVASALNNLGIVYRNGGPEIAQDTAKAILMFEQAGKLKYGLAYTNLGDLYSDRGRTDLYSPEKAIAYYKIADSMGNADGALALAYMYVLGDGIPVDDAEGNKWLRRAASLGEPYAALALAWRAERNLGFDIATPAKKQENAARFEKRAAELGDIDGMKKYGRRLLSGNGVTIDRSAGIDLLYQAGQYGLVASKVEVGSELIKEAGGEMQGRALLGEVVAGQIKAPDPAVWPMDYYEAALTLRDMPDRGDFVAKNLPTSEFRAIFGSPQGPVEGQLRYTSFMLPMDCFPESATGKPRPIYFYAFDWLAETNMITPQINWYIRERGCRMADNLQKYPVELFAIAKENKASFKALLAYALGEGITSQAPKPVLANTSLLAPSADSASCAAIAKSPRSIDDLKTEALAEFSELDPNILDEKVVILLQGKNIYDDQIYTYMQMTLLQLKALRDMMRSQCDFMPADFGNVLAAGKGEPSPELRDRMTREHNMTDVPRFQPALPPTGA